MVAMRRTVTTHLDLTLSGPARLVFGVAAATANPLETERLSIVVDGGLTAPEELVDDHGTRWHTVWVAGASVSLDYRATIVGTAESAPVTETDRLRYLRPSRYCEADTLGPTAAAEFSGLSGQQLLQAVVEWVNRQSSYVAGSSLPTDGAVRTLLARKGVCRDFAHLSIALLRALNVPARLAAVYAPGLTPMEFHAVAEALVDEVWWVVDATRLAPRQSLLRVATGRDAADTAFLTSFGAPVQLTGIEVTATADDFALDDQQALTQLR